jgi:glyoxylase-like metal-dependent hydrolase (beta-lactamase superfamily II)
MDLKAFYDGRTSTLTYVVWDAQTRDAVVIDPVMDYEPAGSTTWTESVEKVTSFLDAEGLKLHFVLETHAHADHLSGSQLLNQACPSVKVAIGRRITEVQETFKKIFDLPADFPTDGSQFDVLLDDGQVLEAGSIRIATLYTPGHTPACVTYRIADMLFTGDALFMPDSGAGRCDFPGGSATALYESVTQRIYTQPDETRIFVGHDYQPGGRELAYETSVGEEKASNMALSAGTSKEDFVDFREQRDAQLPAPKLLFQSVQVNVDAGRLPAAASGGIRYLKIPLNVFKPKDVSEVKRLTACEAGEPTGGRG